MKNIDHWHLHLHLQQHLLQVPDDEPGELVLQPRLGLLLDPRREPLQAAVHVQHHWGSGVREVEEEVLPRLSWARVKVIVNQEQGIFYPHNESLMTLVNKSQKDYTGCLF